MKEVLSQNGIKYGYMDITENMLNLKLFLGYRDNKEEFESVRKEGRVGLPCIVINKGEEILFDLPEDLETLK